MQVIKEQYRKQLDEYKRSIRDFMNYTISEDFMGIILRGHLFIESELFILIKNILVNPSTINLRFFSTKLDTAHSLGVIDKQWYGAFNKLNDIRNNYAHQLGYEFKEKDYEDLVSTLSKEAKEEFSKDIKYEEVTRYVVKAITNEDTGEISLKDKTRILLANFFTYLKLQNLQIESVLKEIYLTKQISFIDEQVADNSSNRL